MTSNEKNSMETKSLSKYDQGEKSNSFTTKTGREVDLSLAPVYLLHTHAFRVRLTLPQRKLWATIVDIWSNDIDVEDAEVSIQKVEHAVENSTAPIDNVPSIARFILHIFLPQKDRVEIIGDLEEEFALIYERDGKRKASFFMWSQAFLSLWPYLRGAAWAATIGRIIGWLHQLRS